MPFQQYPQKLGTPSGNTAGRPSSPVIGDTYYNGQLEILEIYNGTTWVAVSSPAATPSIVSVTDVSTGDAYTATAGKLAVLFQAGVGGSSPTQFNAATTTGGFTAFSSTSTVTLTGLAPGTAYTVYGNAQNNYGVTVNTANFTPVTPTTLPEVRTIGTASTSSVTSDVTVTWTNGNNGGKNLTSITITPFLNGTTAQTSQTAATTSSTSHTFTGLTQGSSYTFKVKATNANGTCADSTATNSVTVPAFITLDYLVVGGGGAGSANFGNGNGAGGGGAGGFRTGTGKSVPKSGFTVTVGAGATGQAGSVFTNYANNITATAASGSNSVFADITSAGGGGGARPGGGSPASGGSGGGGTADAQAGGAGNTPSTSPSQGNNGGPGSNGTPYRGGGGGGAGATGGDGENDGNGGAGTASSITGSSVTYAGGGGGGGQKDISASAGGTGGTGGGGAGAGNTTLNGGNGTANTGGGGGGGAWPGPSGDTGGSGGNGGSGVVILKWLTSAGTISVGAGLTADATGTDGSYSYKKFTAGTGTVSFS